MGAWCYKRSFPLWLSIAGLGLGSGNVLSGILCLVFSWFLEAGQSPMLDIRNAKLWIKDLAWLRRVMVWKFCGDTSIRRVDVDGVQVVICAYLEGKLHCSIIFISLLSEVPPRLAQSLKVWRSLLATGFCNECLHGRQLGAQSTGRRWCISRGTQQTLRPVQDVGGESFSSVMKDGWSTDACQANELEQEEGTCTS